jgi:hypothetical protein
MKHLIIIILIFFAINAAGQKVQSNVEFVGNKFQVLLAKKETLQIPGKLSTGEIIRVGCDRGGCYFRIEYKGRTIEQSIGEGITRTAIYEFDFGPDGDNEIVVINDFLKTSFLFVYSYSKGIIQELFEKEIMYNRTVLKKDYIEYYISGGLDAIWNFYRGHFFVMTPYVLEKQKK